jgi:hypothetical protein
MYGSPLSRRIVKLADLPNRRSATLRALQPTDRAGRAISKLSTPQSLLR